jgi:hypothetical protein
MLIIIVRVDQFSYDKMHIKSKRIFRVQQVDSLSNVPLKMASNPYALRDDSGIIMPLQRRWLY